MQDFLKMLSAKLPTKYQQLLKKVYFSRQISSNTFSADEKEYDDLDGMVKNGDWVIDIGANVGQYTLKLSNLVGSSGRVIAFEPVPETFELLVSNSAQSKYKNITLVNAAVSDNPNLSNMEIPKLSTGLDNYYMAHLSEDGKGVGVLCVTIDSFCTENKIELVKIDAEGHELIILEGMSSVIKRDMPTLIVEDNDKSIPSYLEEKGYCMKKHAGSPNCVYIKCPEL